MSLVNVFSNIWFYFMNASNVDEAQALDRIKQLHGIDQQLNIHQLTLFWQPNAKGELFAKPIDDRLKVEHEAKLLAFWKTHATRLYGHLLQGNEPMIIISQSPHSHECLIGLYIYLLKTYAGLPIQKSIKSLSSKFAGINYTMSDTMKHLLYRVCY